MRTQDQPLLDQVVYQCANFLLMKLFNFTKMDNPSHIRSTEDCTVHPSCFALMVALSPNLVGSNLKALLVNVWLK